VKDSPARPTVNSESRVEGETAKAGLRRCKTALSRPEFDERVSSGHWQLAT